MKKKLTALFLALTMCLSLCTVTFAEATPIATGSTVTWELTENNTKLTIGGTGEMPTCGELGAGQPWKDNRASITSLIVESGVTSIGYNAFSGCTSLASVDIPDSVTSIGSSAFKGCKSLASVDIPNSVNSIGSYAFQDTGLTSVTIPNSVNSIGSYAFQNTALTSVTIPNSVTTIEAGTFNGCKALANVIIPNSITEIKMGAFYSCTNLASVSVEAATPSTLGNGVFGECNGSLKIHVPKGQSDTYKTAWSAYEDYIVDDMFTITVSTAENGTVAANYASAASGTDVTLTVTPDKGYQLKVLSYKGESDASPTDITKDETTGNYQFTMPGYAVTVTAAFEKISGPEPDDDRDVDYEKLAKAGMVAAGVVAGVVVTKIVVDKLHEIKAAHDAAAEVTPEINVEEMPMVAMGSSGDAVTTLQTELNAQGYACGEVDGIFGQNTLNAVMAFQTAKGLTVDGIVGAQTWGALL